MKPINLEPSDLKTTIADHMEKGFLENIIDMFKHDMSLYAYVGDLVKDERIRVRIGVTVLVETLRKEDPENISKAMPPIIPLLKDQHAFTRGDAAYLLGLIGHRDALPFLQEAAKDGDANVKVIAKESIEEIESKLSR